MPIQFFIGYTDNPHDEERITAARALVKAIGLPGIHFMDGPKTNRAILIEDTALTLDQIDKTIRALTENTAPEALILIAGGHRQAALTEQAAGELARHQERQAKRGGKTLEILTAEAMIACLRMGINPREWRNKKHGFIADTVVLADTEGTVLSRGDFKALDLDDEEHSELKRLFENACAAHEGKALTPAPVSPGRTARLKEAASGRRAAMEAMAREAAGRAAGAKTAVVDACRTSPDPADTLGDAEKQLREYRTLPGGKKENPAQNASLPPQWLTA